MLHRAGSFSTHLLARVGPLLFGILSPPPPISTILGSSCSQAEGAVYSAPRQWAYRVTSPNQNTCSHPEPKSPTNPALVVLPGPQQPPEQTQRPLFYPGAPAQLLSPPTLLPWALPALQKPEPV